MRSPFRYLSEKGRASGADFLKGREPYVDVAGLFGAPDEIEKNGLKAFAAIGEVDLMKGRRLYQFGVAMFDSADRGVEFLPPDLSSEGEALSNAARTLRESDEWCVAGLATFSIGAHRAAASVSKQK